MYRTILQKLNLIEQDIESIVPVQSDNGDTHYLLALKKQSISALSVVP